MAEQLESIRLMSANGNPIAIVEITKCYRSPDAVIWENQGLQAYFNTGKKDEETGLLVYESRLTVVSSTSFEDAVRYENKRLAALNKFDWKTTFNLEKALVEDLLSLFIGSFVDWITEQDQTSKTNSRLLKIKSYQQRLIKVFDESIDPPTLKLHLQWLFEETFEKAIRLTSLSKSFDIKELRQIKTDGSINFSEILLPSIFDGVRPYSYD